MNHQLIINRTTDRCEKVYGLFISWPEGGWSTVNLLNDGRGVVYSFDETTQKHSERYIPGRALKAFYKAVELFFKALS